MKIVFLNGAPRSGKNFIGAAMAQMLQGYNEAFANELKSMTHRFFRLPEGPNTYEDLKEARLEEFMGMSPRQAYIWMSEEVVKPKFGVKFFGDELARKIDTYWKEDSNKVVWITDSGFRHEAEAVIDKFGKDNCMRLFVEREGTNFVGDSRSKWSTDGLGIQDASVLNNFQIPREVGSEAWMKARDNMCAVVRQVVGI